MLIKSSALTLALTFLVAACSSQPKNYEANSEATPKLQNLKLSLEKSKTNQVDVFAPDSFLKATDAVKEATEKRDDNQPNEKVLSAIVKAEGLVNVANQKSKITQSTLPGVMEARMAALSQGANVSNRKEFLEQDEKLSDFAADVEAGNIKEAKKLGETLSSEYRMLETKGVRERKLGSAYAFLARSKDEGAEENAPISWATAHKAVDKASELIQQNSRNTTEIDSASATAQFEAEKLLRVSRRTKGAGGASAENLVLESEKQNDDLARQKIATAIANENTSREKDENTRIQGQVASLEGIKDLQDKVSSISKNFSKDEAEVFQQGKNVIVRLRGIKFKVNKAEIPSSSYATLKKVQDSIESLDSSTVIIEGHTDSTGSPSINMPLSKQRAESVRNYMAANLASNNIEVQTEGYGATKPLSSNKTPQGRAVNRRIDVVIQAR